MSDSADLMTQVAAIWAEVLALDDIPGDAEFFDLGGHSLAAIRITARVRELVAQEVPLELVFDESVLSDYVAAVDALTGV